MFATLMECPMGLFDFFKKKNTKVDSTISKGITTENEIRFTHIDEPNDIKLFKSYSANQLKAIVVFRVNSNNLTSPKEAQKALKWMDMSLENQWPQNIAPRQHTSTEAIYIEYRSSKIKNILEDGKYGGTIACDQDFISNHAFFELENTIDGTDYFCIAIFEKH